MGHKGCDFHPVVPPKTLHSLSRDRRQDRYETTPGLGRNCIRSARDIRSTPVADLTSDGWAHEITVWLIFISLAADFSPPPSPRPWALVASAWPRHRGGSRRMKSL